MSVTKNKIAKNLKAIRLNIADAAAHAGRLPDEVTIIAVTKSVDIETIKNCIDAGLTDLAESRTQQLAERAQEISAALSRRRSDTGIRPRWHMIGHLQRNKVKQTLESADCIHSVDSLRLAEEIDERAEQMDKVADVLLQINCSKEAQKFGVAVGAALHLGEMICSLKNLRLLGMMTMAAETDDPETTRPIFTRLRELFEEMQKEKIGGEDFRLLSMGMSQDYQVAVQEGATVLRIGSALFNS